MVGPITPASTEEIWTGALKVVVVVLRTDFPLHVALRCALRHA